MKRVILVEVLSFLIAGCGSQQDASLQNEVEPEAIMAELTTEESMVSETIVKPTLEETAKATVSEALQVQVQVMIEEEVFGDTSAEKIIAENRWGFTIFDPDTRIIEYYTNTGGFLGKKTKG